MQRQIYALAVSSSGTNRSVVSRQLSPDRVRLHLNAWRSCWGAVCAEHCDVFTRTPHPQLVTDWADLPIWVCMPRRYHHICHALPCTSTTFPEFCYHQPFIHALKAAPLSKGAPHTPSMPIPLTPFSSARLFTCQPCVLDDGKDAETATVLAGSDVSVRCRKT